MDRHVDIIKVCCHENVMFTVMLGKETIFVHILQTFLRHIEMLTVYSDVYSIYQCVQYTALSIYYTAI